MAGTNQFEIEVTVEGKSRIVDVTTLDGGRRAGLEGFLVREIAAMDAKRTDNMIGLDFDALLISSGLAVVRAGILHLFHDQFLEAACWSKPILPWSGFITPETALLRITIALDGNPRKLYRLNEWPKERAVYPLVAAWIRSLKLPLVRRPAAITCPFCVTLRGWTGCPYCLVVNTVLQCDWEWENGKIGREAGPDPMEECRSGDASVLTGECCHD